jgi:hypothetical protein
MRLYGEGHGLTSRSMQIFDAHCQAPAQDPRLPWRWGLCPQRRW